MICPECDAEYHEGIDRCVDCDVALVAPERLDGAKGRPVRDGGAGAAVVFRTEDRVQAELVGASLEEEGIPTILRQEFVGGLQLTLGEASSIPGQWTLVLAPAALAERAETLIRELPFAEPAEEGVAAFEDESIEEALGRAATLDRRSARRALAWPIVVLFLTLFVAMLVAVLSEVIR